MKIKKQMPKELIKDIFKNTFKIIVGLGKSIWRATLSIASLIAYAFLLYGLVVYFKLDISSIDSFIELTGILIDNWGIFWWMFFASNIYNEWKWRN